MAPAKVSVVGRANEPLLSILPVSGLEDTMLQIAQEYRVPAGVPKICFERQEILVVLPHNWKTKPTESVAFSSVCNFNAIQKRGFPSKNDSACLGEATCALFGSLVLSSCRALAKDITVEIGTVDAPP